MREWMCRNQDQATDLVNINPKAGGCLPTFRGAGRQGRQNSQPSLQFSSTPLALSLIDQCNGTVRQRNHPEMRLSEVETYFSKICNNYCDLCSRTALYCNSCAASHVTFYGEGYLSTILQNT